MHKRMIMKQMIIKQKDLKSFANVARHLSLLEHTIAVCVADALSRWTTIAREILTQLT
jgi:hypothetical protein